MQPPASSINRQLPRPVLVSPSGIETTSSSTPFFEWRTVELAERYEIQITKTTTFLRDLVQDEMVRTTSFAAPEMQDGVYLWRVRAVDARGDVSLWSDIRRLTVDTVAPQAPNLVSPSEYSVSTNLQPTFRWSKVTDAYRYQVVLSVDSECPAVNASEPLRELWFRPHDPLSQGTYYWCVLAIDAAGNVSMPDDIWEVVVNIATAPEDGEIIIRQEEGYSPLLRWSSVSGATSYTIQIARDASLTDAAEFDVGDRTSYRLEDTLPYGIYYWQVIPDNLPQEMPVVSRFVISPPLLSAPIPQPPVADESSGAGVIVLSWGDVDGASSYEVEITTENGGIVATTSTDVPHYNFSEPVDASDGTIYRWRVRAINAYVVAGEWSRVNNVD